MSNIPSHLHLTSLALIEHLYAEYLKDPGSVDLSWRYFFEGFDFASFSSGDEKEGEKTLLAFKLLDTYRRWGHLEAKINPLEEPKKFLLENFQISSQEQELLVPTFGFFSEKKVPLQDLIQKASSIYSSRIGFEYMHIEDERVVQWISSKIEKEGIKEPSLEEKKEILKELTYSEILEAFLHVKYPGVTRFSLEGCETMIPILKTVLNEGAFLGITDFLICMAHRGRLNVLANVLQKPLEEVIGEFEDDTSLSYFGSDDVKYHMGISSNLKTLSGKEVSVSLAANPSHLESVNPVALGQVYARQKLKKHERSLPVVIHGDAAIAGQGIIYETMQLMRLANYNVEGALHLVVNNQIGYTTLPKEGRSTRYATDIAKTFGCPVFHVNAEDPEACVFAAKLALEIREMFHIDVFIDLLGYRKYGHNEGDEPSYTQPIEYQLIKSKKPVKEIYKKKLVEEGTQSTEEVDALEDKAKKDLQSALEKTKENKRALPSLKKDETKELFSSFKTGVSKESLQETLDLFCTVPPNFNLHPKLLKWLEAKREQLSKGVDWATAECLAFGTLLKEKFPIRLAGQDSQRGTFSQRHIVWSDVKTGKSYSPFSSLEGRLEVVNSALTENAGMGFEFGFSLESEKGLCLWEAQYGDFDNGAQIIIDQYLVCAEKKWKEPSSLVLLLPHGYEGAGPEHSSARPERFLQLAAEMNIQVASPSTPSQYFHLLRRQALREIKKPLVILTPKSLLRSSACTSLKKDFIEKGFEEILDDPISKDFSEKLVLCSGKLYYELASFRKEAPVSLVRIEQFYPFAKERFEMILQKYKNVKKVIWAQEEPMNMGAFSFIQKMVGKMVPDLIYVGREESASTATGSNKEHKKQQSDLIERVFRV